ncbi:predicted protein [Nematostella vectensis]|uniref:Uncharacterized protein n=1 Tax=Nematostella vectensis TaxID=45351 RepID=A7S7W7_NEMVE|nr:calpain-B isoform X1 [Nematostella vectensis]EDO40193.1 predicted protein [Nematostella vectensis]|eukprot:XP_001632256.1 predicted protein [Nematostella vectensis]
MPNLTMDDVRRQVRSTGKPFEDDEFLAIDSSIFFSKRPPRPFEWKRPSDICEDPHMFVGGASRLDIQQGMLGDCWLLAAIAALTQHSALMNKVVPQDYVANPNDRNYTGALKFCIWQYGEWKDVIIDDRLPTYNGKLVFVHSSERNEFWSALLEKAYAKLNGSYESLKGGQTGEALEDFTGGLAESFDLNKNVPKDLFCIMQTAEKRHALMGCSIAAKANEIEAKLNNGLVKGHAYTVTGCRQVKAKTRRGDLDVELVRVRNPWGNEREWKGAWGDGSSEWQLLSDYEKKSIGLTFEDDGEFWMSFDDFKKHFTTLEICMLGADSAMEGSSVGFESRSEHGMWRRGLTAGGCRNFIKTFHKNPQFRITLQDSDDDADDLCTVIIALMQKDRRKEKKHGINPLTIGFSIYKLEEEKDKQGNLDMEFFQYHASTARSPVFINSREVVGRYALPPGEYVVIPTTFNPNEEGNFVLRMYSEKAHKTCEVDEKTEFAPQHQRRVQISREQHDTLNSKFKEFFDNLSGRDGEIDAKELQQILSTALKNDLGGKPFSLEGARSIISMYDEDASGKLGFEEFKETWLQVKKWMKIFQVFDEDKSGEMDTYELRGALKEAGFTLSNSVLYAVSARYSTGDGKVNVDDFMEILTRLNILSAAFQKQAGQGGRRAAFDIDQFLEMGVIL